jgi:hypothetical protein
MPGAVAPDGTVASLKSRAATVLLNVSRGAGLPTKELASVGSTVMAKEAGSVMVALGLQILKGVVTPNGGVIGIGGTKGGGLIEAEGPTEDDGDDIKLPAVGDDVMAPLVGAALAAAGLVWPVIPVVGHVVTAPRDGCGGGRCAMAH